jgi:hypothetical protein
MLCNQKSTTPTPLSNEQFAALHHALQSFFTHPTIFSLQFVLESVTSGGYNFFVAIYFGIGYRRRLSQVISFQD